MVETMDASSQKPLVELSRRTHLLIRQYSRALEQDDNPTIKRILKLSDHDRHAAAAVEYVHGRREYGPWETDDTCVPGSTEDGGCEV